MVNITIKMVIPPYFWRPPKKIWVFLSQFNFWGIIKIFVGFFRAVNGSNASQRCMVVFFPENGGPICLLLQLRRGKRGIGGTGSEHHERLGVVVFQIRESRRHFLYFHFPLVNCIMGYLYNNGCIYNIYVYDIYIYIRLYVYMSIYLYVYMSICL